MDPTRVQKNDEKSEDLVPFSFEEKRILTEERADLWAMAYGFSDAADLKAEGERLAEIAGKVSE